ncbi:MAG: hypothetical protein ACTHKU_01925 [Verrucomicrobiota bacterium]
MNWWALRENFQQVWENSPKLMVFLVLGFIIFIGVVADTWIERRRRKKNRRQ